MTHTPKTAEITLLYPSAYSNGTPLRILIAWLTGNNKMISAVFEV
jgi:hypothetical protein